VAKLSAFRFRLGGALVVAAAAMALAVPAANADGGLLGGLTGALPSATGLGCSTGPSSRVFAPWGDLLSYELAPNGGFESGTTKWTLSGSTRVVSDNESFHVGAASDSRSLELFSGASATSSPICSGVNSAFVRLFVSNRGSSSACLRVQIQAKALTSLLSVIEGGCYPAGPAWAPTPVVVALQLPLSADAVQLKLTAVGAGADLRVDDVYVDPLMVR
jgi:hypothetical protein